MSRNKKSSPPKKWRRLVAEVLEDRACPAGSVTVSGTVMIIQGDNLNDTITVADNGTGGVTASVSSTGGTASGSGTSITAIKIIAGTGSDTINFSLSSVLTSNLLLNLNLSQGQDQVNLNFSKGVTGPAATPPWPQLAVNIAGGAGADTITTNFGALTDTSVAFSEAYGNDGGHSTINFNGAVNQSNVWLNLLGGTSSGDYAINFGAISNLSKVNLFEALGTGATSTEIKFKGAISNSAVNTSLEGDGGNHNIQTTLHAVQASTFHFAANLGLGTSSVQADLLGSIAQSNVSYDLQGRGNDTFTETANSVNIDPSSTLTLFNAELPVGTANMSATYSGQVQGKLNVFEQGGSQGNTLAENLTIAAGSTGGLHAFEGGGPGNDNMTLDLYDNSVVSGQTSLSSYIALQRGGGGSNTLTHTPTVQFS